MENTTPVETPASPTPINPAPKKNNLMFFAAGIIVVILIAGGAYYMGTQRKDTAPAVLVPTPAVTSQIMPSLSPTSIKQVISVTPKVGWKSYTDTFYNYTIQYPSDWNLIQDKDSEGYSQIKLTSNNPRKAAFSIRTIPTLYISIHSPYSTSGAVCANQGCDDDVPLQTTIKNNPVSIPVIKGSGMKDGEKQLDYYAFSYPIPNKKITLEGFSEPVSLNVIASYGTSEEAQLISEIISTLSY